MTYLYQDTETYSDIPITNGVHRYAEGAEVMLFAYAWDDGPVHVVDLASLETLPAELINAQTDPAVTKVMHNSAFDRTVIRHALGIDIPVAQVHDTMVQALAHGLPGALGVLCEIFRVDASEAKDKRGRSLIQLFCQPRPKNQKIRRATKETHPKEWQEFVEYARLDIPSMRRLHKVVPMWNYAGAERALWELDQRINDRGVCIDVELAEAAITTIERAQEKLANRANDMTNGMVGRATQRDKLLNYICEQHGVDFSDMRKDTLERRLDDPELPWAVRDLLRVRLEASMTSAGKYKKLTGCVSSDNRLRGTLQFCGASRTGRWAGRLFQPQNLPRPVYKQKDIDFGIEAIKAGCADLFEENVMSLTSSCIRSVIIPTDGKKLVVSDLSNIEGRIAAWLSGEDWKLRAFADFDRGAGPDLYKISYARAFGIRPEDVDDGQKSGPQRQIGKVLELMLGYEGGVGAFITGAATYKIDLDEMTAAAWPLVPEEVKIEAEEFYHWSVGERRNTFGLEPRTFMACDALKRLWRRANPEIASYWPLLRNSVIHAVSNPGEKVPCRKVYFIYKNNWLRAVMPSGRSVCYPSARAENNSITYMGQNTGTRQWSRLSTYGGKLLENLCQALSRDVMAANMPRIEAEGYSILLSVHDELITEAPDTAAYSAEHLSNLLAANPEWSAGLPLAAGGFESNRYRKD